MKKALLVLMTLFIAPVYVTADYDAALEAEEAAQRAASQREAQRQKAEADRMKADAMAKFHAQDMAQKRKHIGSLADGKSDAEVQKIYDEKVKTDTASAMAAAQDAQQKINSPEASAQMKAVTGKSMQEIMNMSDAEREAWAAQMEKSMGAYQGMN